MTELQVADLAPDFDLPHSGGGTLRLSSLRGSKVVLYFYPKDDTQSCTVEAKDFSALKTDFADAGTMVVGMSPDTVRKHDKFTANYGLSVDLVSDEALETIKAYGVWGEKRMYGVTYAGVIRSTFLIDADGRIARIWRAIRVPGHAQEVLDAARALP